MGSEEELKDEKRIRSVMIVDDSEADVFLTRKFLENSGKFGDIQNAANGEEALELLGASGPDKRPELIFLDINMPRMNGFEFLEEYEKGLALEIDPENGTHILIFTTSDYADDIERAEKFRSVNRYMTKPLTRSTIEEIVEEFGR